MSVLEPRIALTRALRSFGAQSCRQMSGAAAAASVPDPDYVQDGSLDTIQPSDTIISSFDPVAQAKKRPRQLPASDYNFRPPRYYRGPLHPHQPPRPADIASRAFVPGPFSLPRLQQTYESTIAPDLLALTYNHVIPGTPSPPSTDRYRPWQGDNPYFANRPKRGPRGDDVLRPLHKPINFHNVPELTKVVLHTHVPSAQRDASHLHVAGMILQAITNVRVQVHKSKASVQEWSARADRWTSATAVLSGEDMYHFMSKVIEIVLPRIKDWRGVHASTGDETGNVAFGFGPEGMALFPEIEGNYEAYPPHMIPGVHIQVQTTAKKDREARLLLSAMGVPFTTKKA